MVCSAHCVRIDSTFWTVSCKLPDVIAVFGPVYIDLPSILSWKGLSLPATLPPLVPWIGPRCAVAPEGRDRQRNFNVMERSL